MTEVLNEEEYTELTKRVIQSKHSPEELAELEHKKRVAWFTSLPEKTKKRIARRHKKGYKNPKGYFL